MRTTGKNKKLGRRPYPKEILDESTRCRPLKKKIRALRKNRKKFFYILIKYLEEKQIIMNII